MRQARQRTYPAVLTAGDRGRARPVLGKNKAFLTLAGVPVFTHVLAGLEQSSSVDRIYLVGPKASLEAALTRPDIPFKGTKPLKVLDQWDNLYLNVWNTFLFILDELGSERAAFRQDLSILVVPSDIPLLVPEEVDEFVCSCDMKRFDYVVGITSEQVLSRYYPQKHRKGVRLMYFHTREGSYRQNNLHLVKPLQLNNRHQIQKIYDHRLQREWSNIIGVFWEILRSEDHTLRVIAQYALLHVAGILYRIPALALHRIPARLNSITELQRSVSKLLGTRFSTAETHFGGAALDIDTPEHYTAIQENFDIWRRMQREEMLDEREASFSPA